MATRKTAAQKAAEEKAAAEAAAAELAAQEQAEQEAADAAAGEQGEGSGDVSEPVEGGEVKIPATAQLEPPTEKPIPAEPNIGLGTVGRVDGAEGNLAAEMVRNEPQGPRSVIVDEATNKPIRPEDAFELEFPNGSIYVVKARLIEHRYFPGQRDPMSRLVLARGSRIGRDAVARLSQFMNASLAESTTEQDAEQE
jgi:hypothetical protein